ERHPVRSLVGGVRQQLRHDVCGSGVGDDRAGVSLLDRDDLRLWRRAQRRDPARARTQAPGRGGRARRIRRAGRAEARAAVSKDDAAVGLREAQALTLQLIYTCTEYPPSTGIAVPVTKSDAGLARNTAMPANSFG